MRLVLTDRRVEAKRIQELASDADWDGNRDRADALRRRATDLWRVIEIDGPWQPNF
jgi:hypothetical protein